MTIKLRAVFDSPDMADIAVARLRTNKIPFNSIELHHIRPHEPQASTALNEVNILYPYPADHPPGESYSLNGQNTTLGLRAHLSAGWGLRPYRRDGEALLTVTLDRAFSARAREILVNAHGHSIRVVR